MTKKIFKSFFLLYGYIESIIFYKKKSIIFDNENPNFKYLVVSSNIF